MSIAEKLFCSEVTNDLRILIELISKVDKSESKALLTNDKNDSRDYKALKILLSHEAKLLCKKYQFVDPWDKNFNPDDIIDKPPLRSNSL